MTSRPPHVRVEMRKVYVSARGAKLTKHAAYIHAAKDLIAKACKCERAEYNATGCTYPGSTCIYHEKTTVADSGDGCGPDGERMVYYDRVRKRLIRFLKYVDKRNDFAPH